MATAEFIKNLLGGYSEEALKAAFDAVCNPDDWKAPIGAYVMGEDVGVTVKAIQFYTATTPAVSLNQAKMMYLVTSPGYRNGPAGDW